MIASGNQAAIARVIDTFARENEMLQDQLIQLLYYARGALTRDDVWLMAPIERDAWNDFLNKRFKEVGELIKHRVPVFW